MNKKDFLTFLSVSILNFLIGILLILFALPSVVPTIIGESEQIITTGSKWCLILNLVLPALVFCFMLFMRAKPRLIFLFKCIFCFITYQNVLIFMSYALTPAFVVGATYPVSLSLLLFLPLSCFIFVMGLKIKSQTYNTFPKLWKKQSTATEFLWKQTRFFAKTVITFTAFILFIVSIIFAFFKLWLIELGIVIFALIIDYLIILKNANDIFKKYTELQTKQKEILSESKK